MAQIKLEAEVRSQEKLAEGVYSMEIFSPQIAGQAKAGQFISVYTKDKSRLLPRPISLCGIGACLACVCQSKDVDSHSHVHNKRICKDGPVFEAQEVEI